MKYTFFILFSGIVILTSCMSNRDRMVMRITELEKKYSNLPMQDTNQVKEIINAYQNFAQRYPEDSMAAEYLYRAAGACLNDRRLIQSIELYSYVENVYPNTYRAPYSLFSRAFIFENYIKDFHQADRLYLYFIKKYPKHEMNSAAVLAREYVGRSIKEMLDDMKTKELRDTVIMFKPISSKGSL